MLNKLDRAFLELQLPHEEIYQQFLKIIEMANMIAATYHNEMLGEVKFDPALGNVAFGSGLHQWAFTLDYFAKAYAKKFKKSEEEMAKKLWDDSFVRLVLKPIQKIMNLAMNSSKKRLEKMLKGLGVTLKKDGWDLEEKHLLKLCMQAWLPAGDALLRMIIKHLPSPLEAQKYRVGGLYTGPQDDKYAEAMKKCDKEGPLMLQVSKMIPTSEKGRFYAFARVFSGTVKTG